MIALLLNWLRFVSKLLYVPIFHLVIQLCFSYLVALRGYTIESAPCADIFLFI